MATRDTDLLVEVVLRETGLGETRGLSGFRTIFYLPSGTFQMDGKSEAFLTVRVQSVET